MAILQGIDRVLGSESGRCRFVRHCLVLVSSLVFSLAVEAKGPDDYEMVLKRNADIKFDDTPWSEMQVHLPPPPETANLVQIDVGQSATNKFFVDEKSVAYDADDVIRYSLVVMSPSGIRNVSYEGMRCATAERRVYAFGRSDGSWSKMQNKGWVRIEENSLNRQHAALYRDYFCTTGTSVMTTEDARRVLLRGNPGAIAR